MFSKIIQMVGGDPNKREVERLSAIVQQINALETGLEAFSDEALQAKTAEFKAKISAAQQGIENPEARQKAEQTALNEILPQAFAIVREAAKRSIGQRPYDVQLIGGMTLHSGRIAEMRTGEGKTLVATLPVYLNALTGRGVHLITVNDYLARYQARWMAQIYGFLGLQVGLLQMASSTENGAKAYLVDFSKDSPREDQRFLRLVDRREAYAADITYGTNAEFGFDYLRDNMVFRYEDKVQRGHYFAIVDEVDNVLIDEARTPLIISGPAQGSLDEYKLFAGIVRQLHPEEYEVEEKDRAISLNDGGYTHVEQLLGQPLRDPERPEDLTPEQARLQGYLEQALRAQYLYKRNKDYIVQGGKVVIVDEFTGRLMPGRRWSEGLHQAVEAKENVKIEPENITYATITLQNYFRMYQKLAGMTGTALTEAEEFHKIYKLDVLPIPTNLEYQAARPDSPLLEVKAKDKQGYPIAYFAAREDPSKAPRYWRRTDYPDKVYRTAEAKLRAIVSDILTNHLLGRPVLVGTTSVENSERLSNRLGAEMLRRLAQVRLLRQTWFEFTQKEEDGRLYPELNPLYTPLETLEVGTLRSFAKSINLSSINPEDETNLPRLLKIFELPETLKEALRAALQGGIQRQVLNARKHTEESQIIAGAGALGAVTIATNMAGRGVDIKLGGELAEEITAAVNRLLQKNGVSDPYDLSNAERREALLKIDPANYGRYEAEAAYYLKYFDDMEKVRLLGGLHVIGTERHESRRIDNQLRGRAARQGDPGSSRFYLSFEDDLLRMFGGEQARGLMERFQLDYDYPLEHRMVGSILESAQQRVEGSNFDVRKHLLEYDDVINAQRARIYAQRDRIFLKTDLSEDVLDLLRAEIHDRTSAATAEKTVPWRLIAWLESAQPTFNLAEGGLYPSYPFRLLLEQLDTADLPASLLSLMENMVEAEQEHQAEALENLVNLARQSLQDRLEERRETLETALESQAEAEEKPRPQQLLENLSSLTQTPGLRLSNEDQRRLLEDPPGLAPALLEQIKTALTAQTITSLLVAIRVRLGEPLPGQEKLSVLPWEEAENRLREAINGWLENQRQRLTGPKMNAEINAALARPEFRQAASNPSTLLRLLDALTLGQRSDFDEKTHKKVIGFYRRINPLHLAARLAQGRPLEEETFQHLTNGLQELEKAWGQAQWMHLTQNAVTLGELPLAESASSAPASTPLTALSPEQKTAVQQALGLQTINDFYRRILLKVISDLWVDYLTRVEALRVSIGLEAYAQRDPLVQYKGKASELFQNLLTEIRSAAASNLFAYRPAASAAPAFSAGGEQAEEPQSAAGEETPQDESSSGRRKRHKKKG